MSEDKMTAQEHRDVSEGDKFQIESRVALLSEFRYWLISHRYDEPPVIGGEQAMSPLIDRDTRAYEKIKNKALEIIEAL